MLGGNAYATVEAHAHRHLLPADLARADFSRVMYTWDCY